MSELSHLVKAVRENLSPEDLQLLRDAYRPPDPEGYEALFDRLLERVRTREAKPQTLPPVLH